MVGDGDVFIQSKDSFLYVNAVLDEDNRDVSATKEIIEYEEGKSDRDKHNKQHKVN